MRTRAPLLKHVTPVCARGVLSPRTEPGTRHFTFAHRVIPPPAHSSYPNSPNDHDLKPAPIHRTARAATRLSRQMLRQNSRWVCTSKAVAQGSERPGWNPTVRPDAGPRQWCTFPVPRRVPLGGTEGTEGEHSDGFTDQPGRCIAGSSVGIPGAFSARAGQPRTSPGGAWSSVPCLSQPRQRPRGLSHKAGPGAFHPNSALDCAGPWARRHGTSKRAFRPPVPACRSGDNRGPASGLRTRQPQG
jgi:hypothetical protein